MSADDEIIPGRWYLCAQCVTCGEAIPILEVLPGVSVAGDGDFAFQQVPCFHCGTKADYLARTLRPIQAQPAPGDPDRPM